MSLIYVGMDTDKFEKDFLVLHCTRLQGRIAELEKALQRQTKRVKLLEPFLESEPKSQDIRDLEQQALACDWIYTKLPDYSSVNLSVITARRLELITQANTLRGKSERLQSKG
jgi:chromosome condensin MukBEF ATPase and DNA-binding subunit MukB